MIIENHIGKNLVITYTCDLKPEDKEVKHIKDYITSVKLVCASWNKCNCSFDGAKADTPNVSPEFMKLLVVDL